MYLWEDFSSVGKPIIAVELVFYAIWLLEEVRHCTTCALLVTHVCTWCLELGF